MAQLYYCRADTRYERHYYHGDRYDRGISLMGIANKLQNKDNKTAFRDCVSVYQWIGYILG